MLHDQRTQAAGSAAACSSRAWPPPGRWSAGWPYPCGLGPGATSRPGAGPGPPPGARLEIDPDRAKAPFAGLVVVPFAGHGLPREDLVGDIELHLEQDRITRVLFRAP